MRRPTRSEHETRWSMHRLEAKTDSRSSPISLGPMQLDGESISRHACPGPFPGTDTFFWVCTKFLRTLSKITRCHHRSWRHVFCPIFVRWIFDDVICFRDLTSHVCSRYLNLIMRFHLDLTSTDATHPYLPKYVTTYLPTITYLCTYQPSTYLPT